MNNRAHTVQFPTTQCTNDFLSDFRVPTIPGFLLYFYHHYFVPPIVPSIMSIVPAIVYAMSALLFVIPGLLVPLFLLLFLLL